MMFIDSLSIIFGLGLILFFTVFAIYSIIENEPVATKKSIIIGIIISLPFFLLPLLHNYYSRLLEYVLISISTLSIVILLMPIYPKSKKIILDKPQGQIDERNIMFSRAELIPGTANYQYYYSLHPDKKKIDDNFRSNAGLLSPQASKYDPITFSIAEANFTTVGYFKHQVDGEISEKKINVDKEEISEFIKNWLKKIGAVEVGITELKDYHLYSVRGRNYNYNEKVINTHKYAIAIIVEMDKELIDSAPFGPTIMESSQQYLNAGNLAMQLAQFIRNLGYSARAHIDGNYEVVCPLVAQDAGLGAIGRMGLLMTPKYGPRVRISVVTTDLPLKIDKPQDYSWMTTFCYYCKKCAYNCPSKAISTQEPIRINNIRRWQINQEKCFTYWTKIGTDCARCVSVCPFSHPNNFLHNVIRFFIKHSYLFSRFALWMDNVFYGHHPKPRMPLWMKKIITNSIKQKDIK